MTQVKLVILRKIFLASHIANKSLGLKTDECFKSILSSTEDSQELNAISKYLEIDDLKVDESQIDGKLSKIKEILSKVTTVNHFQVLSSKNQQLKMPTNLLLMTPYF